MTTPPAYFVFGVDHRRCSGFLLDRLFTEEHELPTILAGLRRAGLSQTLWLATCDRVVVMGYHEDPGQAARIAAAVMTERAGCADGAFAGSWLTLIGPAAIRHVFALAGSLESRVIGEPYVLGQVKAAWRAAESAGTAGPELLALVQAAFNAAKRIRTDTTIGEHPTSIAAAAVQIVRDVHGRLDRSCGLLIGTGEMGLLMAEQLVTAGIGRISVTAPAEGRAIAVARRLSGHAIAFTDLDGALAGADVVVTAVGSGRILLAPDRLAAALRKRRRRPMVVIDAAVPVDADPGLGALDDIFLYDLDDLERLAIKGRVGREAAAAAATAIVEESTAAFLRARAERRAVPAVVALRRRFEAERARLLAERPSLDAAEATRLLLNRLLHQPSETLRRLAAGEDAAARSERLAAERLLGRLFGLDEGDV